MSWNEKRKQRIQDGLCGTCGKNPITKFTECEPCKIKRRDRQKAAYQGYVPSVAQKEVVRQRRLDRIASGLCSRCGKEPPTKDAAECERCRFVQKEYKQRLKTEAYEHYGGLRCSCCGESIAAFLSLDHINNDGAEHRRTVKPGVAFYLWLKRNNYPEGFQVLCMNCNWGKAMNNGICPHQSQTYD